MLILTRRPGERLCIGDDIVITILTVKGSQVRIGITAPRDVAVDREEIHQRKLADRQVALTVRHDSIEPEAAGT